MQGNSPSNPAATRMPVLFVGHGSPMNAIEDNVWSEGFARLSGYLPRPAAVLAISAHWYVDGTFVTGNVRPRTIHDFGGFPPPLYEVEYPAPGAAGLAGRLAALLGEGRGTPNMDWGLDHGTWSVLRWMYPDADVPVMQLSIDRRLSVERHHELGRALFDLRHQGVLIFASGNVVHNLRDAFGRRRTGDSSTPDWALRFDRAVKAALEQRDTSRLLHLATETEDGRLAHPTLDHWLPLIYASSVTDTDDSLRFPTEGFDWGSISMRNVLFG